MADGVEGRAARAAGCPGHRGGYADEAGFGRYGVAPVGSQEVEEREHAVDIFRAWDASRGGGLQR
ncbi:hypothetical protein CLM83_16910, partial [Streptomyces albidoflavus]